jgi:hypothetical protein
MKTLLRDSNIVLAGLRHISHRQWFTNQARGRNLVISGDTHVTEIPARINHGRWIADCPLDCEGQPCGGAECVTEDDTIFYCLSCGNEQIHGAFIRVLFPPTKKRNKIEKILALRPESLRNWFPGETPKKLAHENYENNIPIPEGILSKAEKRALDKRSTRAKEKKD